MDAQNLSAEYQQLNRFVGQWHTEGLIPATESSPEIQIHGTDSYEWLPGNYFLLHKVDVWMGTERNQTLEIIGFDKDAGHYTMHHFDNKGQSGLMTAQFNNDCWTFKGETLQFKGGFSQHDKVFSGEWQQKTEKNEWVHFMNIKLVKDPPIPI